MFPMLSEEILDEKNLENSFKVKQVQMKEREIAQTNWKLMGGKT